MKKFFPQRLTEAYLSALFFLLPLGLHRTYFDITETKTLIFALLTLGYVLASLFCLLRFPEGEWSVGAGAFVIFALFNLTASVLFGGGKAFLGADNRYQGVLVFALYTLSFCFCQRWGKFAKAPQIAALTALTLTALLALGQSFGLDLLSLWDGLRETDRGRYLSTIGNVNFLGAYISLLLPLCAALYCKSRNRALLPALALASCALLCGSDAGIAGTAGGALLLHALCAKKRETHRAFGVVLTVVGLSFFLYGLTLPRFGLLDFSAAGEILTASYVSLPLAALGIFLARRGEALRRGWLLFAVPMGSGALTLLLANLCPQWVPERLQSYVIFSPSWGSDRGSIWLHAWNCYRSQGLFRRLIGGGSGVLARYDLANRLFEDTVVDSAHNEYLHYLLTGGALGLAAYLLALAYAIRRGIRSDSALTAAVFAYALQSAVNIAQCTTTPLFFMLLALLCGGNDSCAEKGKQL